MEMPWRHFGYPCTRALQSHTCMNVKRNGIFNTRSGSIGYVSLWIWHINISRFWRNCGYTHAHVRAHSFGPPAHSRAHNSNCWKGDLTLFGFHTKHKHSKHTHTHTPKNQMLWLNWFHRLHVTLSSANSITLWKGVRRCFWLSFRL